MPALSLAFMKGKSDIFGVNRLWFADLKISTCNIFLRELFNRREYYQANYETLRKVVFIYLPIKMAQLIIKRINLKEWPN